MLPLLFSSPFQIISNSCIPNAVWVTAAACSTPPHPTCSMQPHTPCSTFHNTVHQHRHDNVQSKLSRLFRPHQGGTSTGIRKRKRETPWSHAFICLPEPQWNSMPTVEEARYDIYCGFGQKTVWLPHNEGDHTYFAEHLFSAFPPLREAGGFVLSRATRAKVLEDIPIPPEGYSLSFVRSSCTRAPLYIIPLQQRLALSPPSVDDVGFNICN